MDHLDNKTLDNITAILKYYRISSKDAQIYR